MGIDLYQVPGSAQCRAVLMTVKHLKLEVNVKNINMEEGEHLKPEFLKINPEHCVPTLVDNGFALWESRTIMRYLVNEYFPGNSLYPNDAKKRAVVDRVLDFDLGSLYSSFAQYFYPQIWSREQADSAKEKVLKDKLQVLDTLLVGNKYIAGESLTLADFSVLASITTIEAAGIDISSFGNIRSWLTLLQTELPYYNELVTEPVNQFKAWVKSRLP